MKTLLIKRPYTFSPRRTATRPFVLKSILPVACMLLLGFSAFGGSGSSSGGGGGGGTATASSFKLNVSKNGSGTVTMSPSGKSFAPGTVVMLTATPAAGSPWNGWSGSIFGNFAVGGAQTITVTMSGNISLTANFK
jgi:Divergent InlB B-repeat domain